MGAGHPKDTVCQFPGDSGALYIRYSAKRPLLYCYKDGGVLIYSGHEKLLKWYVQTMEVRKLEERISSNYSPAMNGNDLISWGNSLGAKYLVVPRKYKKTKFDFGNLRTIQCYRYILVDLSSSNNKANDIVGRNLWSVKPKGPVIDLLSFEKQPKWIKKDNDWDANIVNFNDDKEIHLINNKFNDRFNMSYVIKTDPGEIYIFSAWIYYETDDPNFNISVSKWKARQYGGKNFKDVNSILSEPGKWKKHEILIVILPETYPNSVKIKWDLVNIIGKGKVIIKNPTLQYLDKFPLRDSLSKNPNFCSKKITINRIDATD